MPDEAEIESILGHPFKDRALPREALIHTSVLNEKVLVTRNYDGRFAFLGDAVIDLALAEDAYHEGGGKGELTEERKTRARNEHLASTAARLNLMATQGGAKTNAAGAGTIRADTVEALVGAVFLDAGSDAAMAAARKMLQREGTRTLTRS